MKVNKCSDRSTERKLTALFGNYNILLSLVINRVDLDSLIFTLQQVSIIVSLTNLNITRWPSRWANSSIDTFCLIHAHPRAIIQDGTFILAGVVDNLSFKDGAPYIYWCVIHTVET